MREAFLMEVATTFGIAVLMLGAVYVFLRGFGFVMNQWLMLKFRSDVIREAAGKVARIQAELDAMRRVPAEMILVEVLTVCEKVYSSENLSQGERSLALTLAETIETVREIGRQ